MNIAIESLKDPAIQFHATSAGSGQAYLIASIKKQTNAPQAAAYAYTKIARELRHRGMQIVHERIFGSLPSEPIVLTVRKKIFQEQGISPDSPVTYVQGHPPWGEGLAGVNILAVACEQPGDDVWTIMDGNIPCGRGWRRQGCNFLVLQNLHAYEIGPYHVNTRPLQAECMIDIADRILRKHGATYRDVVRTWFYLSDILDWYAEFNKERNEKYGKLGLLPGPGNDRLLPASTGVSGSTSSGCAGVMDLIAVAGPDDSRPFIKHLQNNKQADAVRYGSAFSRGILIRDRDVSFIQVSGTAAIDEHGASLYPGDIHGQIQSTFDKVETLIGQEGAGLTDICAATVFVKRPEDADVFWEMAADRGLEDIPAVCVVADVCREELLFEMDAEVVVDRKGNNSKAI